MKIVDEREWSGGLVGKEITISVPACDRVILQFDDEEGERIDAEVSLQHDGRSRVEIAIVNGSIVLYT